MADAFTRHGGVEVDTRGHAFFVAFARAGEAVAAAGLWAAMEAEESRGSMASWARDREIYAAHIPRGANVATLITLEEAVDYGLATVD